MLRDLRHRFSGLCGHGSCAAQYEQSAVSGTVPDLQAGPIPHVRIQIQHAETGLMRSTLSSSSGVFVLSGLPLGEYTLVASHEGFGEARLRGIRLSVSQTQSIDLTMKLAARAEDVAVTAKLGEVDQASAAFGTRMERDLVNRLPAQRPELGLDAPAACRGDRSGTFIREVCALAGMAATTTTSLWMASMPGHFQPAAEVTNPAGDPYVVAGRVSRSIRRSSLRRPSLVRAPKWSWPLSPAQTQFMEIYLNSSATAPLRPEKIQPSEAAFSSDQFGEI
jgi:hypothetical protein